jgi:hypothetical protein
MQMLPCRRDLYAYETRILFLLLNQDREDVAREIGRSLRESNVAVEGVFTAPSLHQLGSAFLHSLMPDALDGSDKIVDIDMSSDQVVSELGKKANARHCAECRELMKLIPSSVLCPGMQFQHSGCHTVAVAPEINGTLPSFSSKSETGSHVVECIIDQRTGQAHLQWLM